MANVENKRITALVKLWNCNNAPSLARSLRKYNSTCSYQFEKIPILAYRVKNLNLQNQK